MNKLKFTLTTLKLKQQLKIPLANYSSQLVNKKNVCHPMQKGPKVSEVESGWYEWWEQNNYFKHSKSEGNFVMLLPPPNVTGKLHMGHAVTCFLQDAIVKWNQMSGRRVLWIPGCDHAGIGTQVVVERHLRQNQGLSRHDIGQERFTEELWKWKKEKMTIIYEQMKRMGVMLDWDRSYFTLDPEINEGVIEAFVRLFERGLIHRSPYMINWCCTLQSVISDLEVEMVELTQPKQLSVPGHQKAVSFGYLYDIKYQLVNSRETVTVSTTRPETMLGDTAVMVHPDDPRYTHIHGKEVVHPFRGDHIPIITDTQVSKELGTVAVSPLHPGSDSLDVARGLCVPRNQWAVLLRTSVPGRVTQDGEATGAVKVTPGHSFEDFQVGKRHNLPTVEIFDDRGWTAADGIPNQPRFEARQTVLDLLSAKGLYGGCKPHVMRLPCCSRSGDVIEPRLKFQWFLNIKEMANVALRAVEENQLRFHPSYLGKVWHKFLSEDRDWCLSRQLWWGHRVPVYWASTRHDSTFGREEEKRDGISTFVAAASKEEATLKAASLLGVEKSSICYVEEEKDVLDTWFSSALLPFIVLGWPKKSSELDRLFPLSLMETGHDILFFWVARMVMMSISLTEKLPFHDVLLHGVVCDDKGKMSKSKGNALDPLDVIEGRLKAKQTDSENYGADALRFHLCSVDVKVSTFSVDLNYIRNAYTFRNKMWQSLRFFKHHIGEIPDSEMAMENCFSHSLSNFMDKWLLSHLAHMVEVAHEAFISYNVHHAAQGVHTFWYFSLCDIYLETCKPRLWNHPNAPQDASLCMRVLWTAFHTSILTLVPFMPFLAEEMYAHLPSTRPKSTSVLQCQFPHPNEWSEFRDQQLEDDVKLILDAVYCIRNLRTSHNIVSKKPAGKGSIFIDDKDMKEKAKVILNEVSRLSYLSDLSLSDQEINIQNREFGLVKQEVRPGVFVQLELKGMVDMEVERKRLSGKIAKLQKKKETLNKTLKRMNPETVQEEVKLKIGLLDKEIEDLNILLENVQE